MRPQAGENNDQVKHVVIVGGGFAGLNCAKKLAKHPDVRVTLIDKSNYQQFQPLLYQVASSALSPSDIAFNLRSVLREHPNVDIKVTEIASADLAARTVKSAEGNTYQGDFLVLAAESQANFFGTPGADKYSYPLYSVRDAEALRSRNIAVLESAARDPSLVEKGKWCAQNILADIAGKPRKPFAYFDKGIMAMIGRNSAVAEVGEHRHELKGAVAFAAWLGVHAALLTLTRAKIEAFVEWAWDYFGRSHGDAILDRVDEAQINWNDDE